MLRIDNLKMYKTSKFMWNLSKDTKTLQVLKQGTKSISVKCKYSTFVRESSIFHISYYIKYSCKTMSNFIFCLTYVA